MKNIIEIETAEELIEFARQNRAKGDETPCMSPENATLIFDGITVVALDSKDGRFQLSRNVTYKDVLEAMAKACNINARVMNHADRE